MLILRPTRTLALVAAGLAGLPGIGCGRESERPPRLETAAATATPTSSTAPIADTSVVAQKPASDTSVASQPRTESAGEPAAATPEAGQDKWLSYNAATNTVTFELIAGPFTFNGYRSGEGTLVVPPKANIVMNFINKDGTPHSALITPGEDPIPNSASTPAIQRAYTIQVLQGLPQEGTDAMRFPVPESGTYRIFCGVPGHGLSGMWIWLKIDPAAKAPSFGPTKP